MVLEVEFEGKKYRQPLKSGGVKAVIFVYTKNKRKTYIGDIRWGGSPIVRYAIEFAKMKHKKYAKDVQRHGKGHWLSEMVVIKAKPSEFEKWLIKHHPKFSKYFYGAVE